MTIYRHTAKGISSGGQWSTSIHTSSAVAIAAASAGWATAWQTLWNGLAPPADNMDQLFATNVETLSLVTSQLDPVTGHQIARAEDDVTLLGTSAASTLPPQCSAGITWLSNLASKKGRGRMYLPPMSTSSLTAGLINTASRAIIKAAADNLLAELTAATLAPVIFDRTTLVATPITIPRVGNVVNTQRRRRDKLVPSYISG
jgi:hypothetical protein